MGLKHLLKYVHDATHVINQNFIQVEPEGYFQVEPDCILDKKEIFLWNRTIGQVKVQWKHLGLDEETQGLESDIPEPYSNLFQEESK